MSVFFVLISKTDLCREIITAQFDIFIVIDLIHGIVHTYFI